MWVDMGVGVYSDRRRLLRVLGRGAVGAGIFGLTAATRDELTPSAHGTEVRRYYPRVRVASIAEVGAEPIAFGYPDEASPCFLVRLDRPAEHGVGPNEAIVAFSRICPHMGCPIERVVVADAQLGPCGCHYSAFDLAFAGRQLQGQSTEDLPQVLLETDDDTVWAVGMRGLVYGRFANVP